MKPQKKRALFSLSNKNGAAAFAKQLQELGWEIVSTGGTKKVLEAEGVSVISVEDITGLPPILGDRVKTIGYKIFGGILGDTHNTEHAKEMQEHDIPAFGMVVVDLYDFLGKPCIARIDVGGPSMLRAAAKNHLNVLSVCDQADYAKIIQHLTENGTVPDNFAVSLARKTFSKTAKYDTEIAAHFDYCVEHGIPVELGDH